uniref:Pleckstrin homology domain-containing family S member 1 n=1 Tax=Amazona collaria TaxID=241587 RepID=A0A8B9FBC4_9PSIT
MISSLHCHYHLFTVWDGVTNPNTFCPEGGVCKRGFLIKSPPLHLFSSQNSWKRRFFILSKSSKGNYILKYLKGQNIKGSIAVDQIINIEVGISKSEMMEMVRKMFKCLPEQVMSISTGNRCYYLIGSILGSPVRSGELDLMILMDPFQLEVSHDSMVSDVFPHSQIKDETQLQKLDIFVPLADIDSCLKLTEAAGQICVSQWTGPHQVGCLFNHGDHIVAVNDLQPQNAEEAYFFISRSTKKEVSLTNLNYLVFFCQSPVICKLWEINSCLQWMLLLVVVLRTAGRALDSYLLLVIKHYTSPCVIPPL